MTVKPYQADFLLLLVAISWGTTFLLVQKAVDTVPVTTFLLWRFGWAFALMLPIAWSRRRHLDRPTLGAAALLGLFNFGAYALQTYGLTLTLSSSVAFITGLFVVMVPFLGWILFGQKASRPVWIAGLVAAAGLWLLTMQGELRAGWGEVYTLGCAVLFSLHLIYTGRFARRYDIVLLVTFQFGTMALGSALLSILRGESLLLPHWGGSVAVALVITVLFATMFAFWVQTSMQRFTTASRAALIFTMEPLSAAVFGHLYGGEVLSGLQMLGGGLIVAAMLVAELATVAPQKTQGT